MIKPIIMLLAASFIFPSVSGLKLARSNIGRKNLSRGLAMVNSFYDIVEKDASGNDFSFSKFKGKVVYGVNVASKCGYTASGYELLSRLAALKDKGIEVAIFPCNQFGAQEPGTDAEIANFCAIKGVKGANVFTKADVNGPKTRPTYQYVKEKTKMGDIAWNFAGKFIVDKEGNVLPVKSEKSLEQDILALATK